MTFPDKDPVSVLYVDDEEILLDLARVFLEGMGSISVTKAASVAEALPLLASSPFDAIVSDYQMPVTDGIEFLKQVKQLYPGIPFILFTGRGREEVAIQALNNGAAFYIQKGGDPNAQFTELAYKIRNAVAQSRAEKELVRNLEILRHQEQVIREREQYYRAVFENTGTAMVVIEENGIISLCNAECERLSGYLRAEIEGKMHWTEFVAGADRERMLAWHRLRLENGGKVPRHYDCSLISRGGDRHTVFLTVDLIPGTRKSVASLIDITGRIPVKEALQQSETLDRTIFRISPDPLAMTDLEGKLVRVSPAALRLFGLESDEDAVGRSLFDWIAPESRETIRKLTLAFIRSAPDQPVSKVYPLVRRNGSRFFGEISSSVLTGAGGRPVGMISVLRDATDRLVAENALKRSHDKLEILATMTRHDILDQLTSMLGYIDLALQVDDPAVLRDYLAKIRVVADMVGSQMQFSRDYQNLGSDQPCWQNISDLVGTSLSAPAHRNVRISSRTGSLEIFADPLLGRVFFAIVDSILLHGRAREGIVIRSEEAGSDLFLVFESHGTKVAAGEPEETVSRVYGRMTGLSLFVAREILAITGMTIADTGTPENGARLEIRIPAGSFRFPGDVPSTPKPA